MPWALQSVLFAEWLFYEYSAEKAVDYFNPIQSSQFINFVKSSEDVYNLFFLIRKGVLQSLNLLFPF